MAQRALWRRDKKKKRKKKREEEFSFLPHVPQLLQQLTEVNTNTKLDYNVV